MRSQRTEKEKLTTSGKTQPTKPSDVSRSFVGHAGRVFGRCMDACNKRLGNGVFPAGLFAVAGTVILIAGLFYAFSGTTPVFQTDAEQAPKQDKIEKTTIPLAEIDFAELRQIGKKKREQATRDQAIVDASNANEKTGDRMKAGTEFDLSNIGNSLSNVESINDDKVSKMVKEVRAHGILRDRKIQREVADKAPPEIVQKTRDIIYNISNREGAINALRAMTPEERQEVMRLAPGVAQQMGDAENRDGYVWRALRALNKGVSDTIVNPISELLGISGTEEEIAMLQQLESLRAQEAGPSRADDPWYVRGPLGAIEMAHWAMLAALLLYFIRSSGPIRRTGSPTGAKSGRMGK